MAGSCASCASSRAARLRRPGIHTAVGALDRVDHLESAAIIEPSGGAGRKQRRARNKALHAALDAPAVVRAGDDLLARIAALVKGDRTERIEIQHLRDEFFGGRRVDLRHAVGDIKCAPSLPISARSSRCRAAGLDAEPARRRIAKRASVAARRRRRPVRASAAMRPCNVEALRETSSICTLARRMNFAKPLRDTGASSRGRIASTSSGAPRA